MKYGILPTLQGNTRRRVLLLFAGFLPLITVFCFPVTAQQTATTSNARLEQMQAIYISELAKINTAADKAEDQLQTDYLKTLSGMKDSFQSQGSLDAVLALDAEIKRFNEEKSFPAEKNLSLKLPALKAYQERYTQADRAIPVTKAQRTVNLATQYDASLQRTIQDLTKKGDIETALLFKEERDGLWSKREIVQAKNFLLKEEKGETEKARPTKTQVEFKGEGAGPAPDPPSEEEDKTKEAIKARYRAFCAAVLAEDFDKASSFFPPKLVEFAGKEIVIANAKKFAESLSKITRADETALVFDEIRVFGGKFAQVRVSVKADDETEALPNTSWMLNDDTWYVNIHSIMRPRADDRKNRDVPKRGRWKKH